MVGGHGLAPALQSAHILAAATFGNHCDLQPIAWDDLRVDHSRSVIFGIGAYRERLVNYGLAEIALLIPSSHALLDRFVEITAHDMNILPHLQKDHRQTRVLTEGHSLLAGHIGVLKELIQYLATHRRDLSVPGLAQGFDHVIAQMVVGLDAEPGDRLGNLITTNLSHCHSPYNRPRRASWPYAGRPKSPSSRVPRPCTTR